MNNDKSKALVLRQGWKVTNKPEETGRLMRLMSTDGAELELKVPKN